MATWVAILGIILNTIMSEETFLTKCNIVVNFSI